MDRLRRHPLRVATCVGVVALVFGVVAAGFVPQAKASPSGWNIVVGGPGSPAHATSNALLLGDTCADAWSCWAFGVSDPGSGNNASQVGTVADQGPGGPVQTATAAAQGVPVPVQSGEPPATSASGPQALAEYWNGSSWSTVPVAEPSNTIDSVLYDATCVTQSDCWAVGGDDLGSPPATAVGPPPALGTNPAAPASAPLALCKTKVCPAAPGALGTAAALVEHWNGTAWSLTSLPSTSGYLESVTCPSASDCWAVGSTLDQSDDPLNSFVLHWDGSRWTNTAIPPSGQTYDELNSITCTSVANCWAVGTASANPITDAFDPNLFPNVPGAETYFLHWDGTDWSGSTPSDPSSPTGAYLSGVTCATSSVCWAVGTTVDQNGDPQNALVERWNGSSWSPSPAGSPGVGAQLSNVSCVSASDCWAAGTVGSFGAGLRVQTAIPSASPAVPFIERWDGGSWWIDSSPYVTSNSLLYGMACVHGAQCFATGAAMVSSPQSGCVKCAPASSADNMQPLVEETGEPSLDGQGFYAAGADGGIFNFGDAGFYGSMSGMHLNAPVMGVAAIPDRKGYWEVAADGGVFTFGDAAFYGSMGGDPLNAPIVGIASTPDGKGYWEVAADGGVFCFGDAGFYESMGGVHLDAPVLGLAPTPDGKGYWEVASDGGVFAFGDAAFYGSMGGTTLDDHMVGIASTPDGRGYWEVGADGGVFAFGDADFNGSTAGDHLYSPVVAMTMTPDGRGYWLITAGGAVYNEGDANWLGSLNDIGLTAPVTSLSSPA